MPIVVECIYRAGGAEERLKIRDVHLEYMIGNEHLIRLGGALLSDDGAIATGMFLVLVTERVAEARAFVDAEPYSRAGLFETVNLKRLQQFVPHEDPDFLASMLSSVRAGRGLE